MSDMRGIDRQAARFLVDVADALQEIRSGSTDYGEFYVDEALINFDGERTGFRIVNNEHGDYDLIVGDPK